MTTLVQMYREHRLIHVNVNVLLAGIVSAALTTLIMSAASTWIEGSGALALSTAAVDGLLDVIVFAGLHGLVSRWHAGPQAPARELAEDTLRLQVQRWVLMPAFYVLAIAAQWLTLEAGVSLAVSVWVAYLGALLVTRLVHSVWGLRTGQFELPRPL